MKIEKTKAEISNVNPRKEAGPDGTVLASDVSVRFSVPRAVVDKLFPVDGFTDQFYADDDTRLDVIYPIRYTKKVEDLRITLHIGLNPLVFEGAKIGRNMKLTPQAGQYVQVQCKLQLHPTREQSGKLDEAVQEWIDLEIEPMNLDIEEVTAEAA